MSANSHILTPEELAECRVVASRAALRPLHTTDTDTTWDEAFAHHAALLAARSFADALSEHLFATSLTHVVTHIKNFRDTRYPLPVREVPRTVRIAGDDLQVRDGRLWMLKGSGWRPCDTTVDELVRAFLHQSNYADAALLCDLAANPVEVAK